MGFVLQDQLLQEKERALVDHTLAHLNLTGPRVRGPRLLAVIALLVVDDELDPKGLLQHSIVLYFLLHGKFQFYPTRMGLRPNELSIQQFHFLEALHVL